jgi:Transposase IS116/IS110/IS902 family
LRRVCLPRQKNESAPLVIKDLSTFHCCHSQAFERCWPRLASWRRRAGAASPSSGSALPPAMCFRRRSSPPCVCLCAQLDYLTPAIGAIDEKIQSIAKADPTMLRLCTVPGVGFLTAHAIVAAVGDGRRFASARDFAAWAGMTPREDSSAGKRRMEGLSRQGERRLRKLLALGWPRPRRRPGSRLGGVDLGKDLRAGGGGLTDEAKRERHAISFSFNSKLRAAMLGARSAIPIVAGGHGTALERPNDQSPKKPVAQGVPRVWTPPSRRGLRSTIRCIEGEQSCRSRPYMTKPDRSSNASSAHFTPRAASTAIGRRAPLRRDDRLSRRDATGCSAPSPRPAARS